MSRKPADQTRDEDVSPVDPLNIASDEILGARQWKRSKLGYITGVGAFRDSAQSVLEGGKDSMERLRGLAKLGFGREQKGRAVPANILDAQERFNAAMFLNGKNDKAIADSIKTTHKQAIFYFVLLALTVVLGLGSMLVFGLMLTQLPVVDLLFRLIPAPVLGALTLRAAYTNWLFRRRALLSMSDFFKAKDRMPAASARTASPKPPARGGKAVRAAGLFLALALAGGGLLDATPALADNPTQDYSAQAQQIFEEPNSEDIFIQVLAFLVPGVGPVPTSSVASDNAYFTATKTAFMTFSGTLLFLGSAIAGWQILSGLVAAAKEGKVLGQSYHEVWAPARMVIGFGMLAPIAGGLCAAQIVVLYLIVFGSNLGNLVWMPYITTITSNGNMDAKSGEEASATLSVTSMSLANTTLKEILDKELCYATLKAHLDLINVWDNGNIWDTRRNWIETNPQWRTWNAWTDDATLLWRNEVVHGYDYGSACGTATVRVANDSTEDMEQHVKHVISTEQLNQVKAIQSAIRGDENMAYATMIANSYVSRDLPPESSRYFREGVNHTQFINLLNTLRSNYVKGIAAKVQEVYNGTGANGGAATLNEVRESAIKNGWAASGVFYLTLSRIQNSIYAAAGSGSRFSATYMSGFGPAVEATRLVLGSQEEPGVLTAFDSWWETNITAIAGDLTAASAVSEMSDNGWAWMNEFFIPMLGVFKWDEGVNPLNPMQHMIEFGNRLMFNGSATYLAIAGAEAVAGGIADGVKDSGVPIASGIGSFFATAGSATVGALAGLAKMMALVAIAAGAVHAYVLPMVPYIMTAFFVGGMVILTVEALVAAPIWAFFHIRMDGQDFVSDVQKPGYMIAFNLLLRPALMVFGLILSYLVFGGMAWFVEKTFFPTASSMASSQGVGPIGLIVMIVMVTYIHYQMAIRAFSLITQVPDRVSRWFGQGGEHLGEEQDSEKSAALIVRETGGRVEGMARFGGMRDAMRGAGGGKSIGGGKPGKPGETPSADGDSPEGDAPGGGGGSSGGPPAKKQV